ncbi:unnamed protein product [Amoebophrya sp. A120]|nr:unnamed protein product [Amoebophrya sp. A120]|eukprot:GSA120T00017641001.1
MPSSAVDAGGEAKFSARQRKEWAYLEERAQKIRSGEVQPQPGNEMDDLAAFVATKLPELYQKHHKVADDRDGTQSDSGLPRDSHAKYIKKKEAVDHAEGNAVTNLTRSESRFLDEPGAVGGGCSGANAELPVTSIQRDHAFDPKNEGPFGPWEKDGVTTKKKKSKSKKRDVDDAASDVSSVISSASSYLSSEVASSYVSGTSIGSSASKADRKVGAEQNAALFGDTLGLKKKSSSKKKKKRSKSAAEGGNSKKEDVKTTISISDDGSYVSNPIVYTEQNPPLFDKYFFYSNKIMKNIGRYRPPQNGVRTLGTTYSLDQLIEKNGGIPEMAKEKTDYKRNFRFAHDTRSEISVDLANPVTKHNKPDKKIDITTTSSLEKSHLKAGEEAHVYEHQFLYPMPSMAPRVFADKHVAFDKLFKHRVKIRRPKDYD